MSNSGKPYLVHCTNTECRSRSYCANFLNESAGEGQVYPDEGCNIYWPTDQLLGDDAQGNVARKSWSPNTKHHRRKGGHWQ